MIQQDQQINDAKDKSNDGRRETGIWIEIFLFERFFISFIQ